MSAQDDAIAALQDDGVTATANQVLVGATGGVPVGLDVPASRILARLASGDLKACTVAEIVTLLALSAGFGKRYDVTVANCSNTTTETTVATVSIPADEWADGETMFLSFDLESRQFSGGSLNLTAKIKYGASSFTLSSAVAVANNTTIGRNLVTVSMRRKGADIIVPAAVGFPITSMSFAFLQLSTDAYSGRIISAPGFDTTKDITLTVQWSGANANTYFNVIHAFLYKL